MAFLENYVCPHKLLIVCPVVGRPYIARKLIHEDERKGHQMVYNLRDIVGGCVEQVNNNKWFIHPFFATDDKKWGWVDRFVKSLRKNQYKLWVNDCGSMTEEPNMAMCYKTTNFDSLKNKRYVTREDFEQCEEEIRPIFGRCAIEVKGEYVFNFEKDNQLQLRYVDSDEPMYSEPEDDIDESDPYSEEKAYDEYKGK